MAGSVNKVILIGNLGKDPEVRRLNSGDQVVNFSVATSETWRDKTTGERKERTEWHNVVIFNENLGKVAEQYCKKGSKVYIEGQLQTRKWQDQSGADRYTTEVVLQRFRGELKLLDSRGGGGEGRDSFPDEGAAAPASTAPRRRAPPGALGGGGGAGAGRSTTIFRSERGLSQHRVCSNQLSTQDDAILIVKLTRRNSARGPMSTVDHSDGEAADVTVACVWSDTERPYQRRVQSSM